MEPNMPDIITLAAKIQFLLQKLDSARTTISSALQIDPSHGPAKSLQERIQKVHRLINEARLVTKVDSMKAIVKYSEALEVSIPPVPFPRYTVIKITRTGYRRKRGRR